MKLNFMSIVELIFPLSDDERAVRDCSAEIFAEKFNPYYHHGITSLSSFKDGTVRSAIHLNKFHGNEKAQRLLCVLVHAWFATLTQQKYILLPVPLSRTRERKRGYNQVTIVAQKAVQDFPTIQLRTDVLVRTKDTHPQTSLPKAERLLNVHKAFEVMHSKGEAIAHKHIILLDDVATTGTTLREASNALTPYAPLSITLCSFAR